jgi:coniferyl-aldehyde dehydrogenase
MQSIPTPSSAETPASATSFLRAAFDAQKAAAHRAPFPDRRVRDRRLSALGALLHDNMAAIEQAISADFGHRSAHETKLLDIFPSLEAVRYARRHLNGWMKPERRWPSLWFLPGRARIFPQPLGVVGVIAPWNYPVVLAAGPLVAALAAGNRVMVKMSEFTPETSALLSALFDRYFQKDEVIVVEGDAALANEFAELPFDHLLFTGSAKIGQSVMRAAAANLTPVTLELGGKSPAIIGPGYPMTHAAERIIIGKCLNAGQTCIAPDYVLLPAGQEEAFVDAARRTMGACYPNIQQTPDYSSIINARHYERLRGYLGDARSKGARIIPLCSTAPDPARRRMPPVALLDTNPTMHVMQEEIFGPLLPVVAYANLDEAIEYVRARPSPLALYCFDHDKRTINRLLKETLAGGVTVNDTFWHIAQDSLPFGGVGQSGMGHYHGREGFDAFSKRKPVFFQSRFTSIGLFKPPYGRVFDMLVSALIR